MKENRADFDCLLNKKFKKSLPNRSKSITKKYSKLKLQNKNKINTVESINKSIDNILKVIEKEVEVKKSDNIIKIENLIQKSLNNTTTKTIQKNDKKCVDNSRKVIRKKSTSSKFSNKSERDIHFNNRKLKKDSIINNELSSTLVFKPKLNKRSILINDNLNNSSIKHYDKLLLKGENYKKSIEKKKDQRIKQSDILDSECTFKPKLISNNTNKYYLKKLNII